MKSEKKILFAFILNALFAVFEIIGGILTGSVAILSDAVHDMGDAMSIGLSVFLEKKSKRPPDDTHTYGYAGYSLLGSAITILILLLGSLAVVWQAMKRLWNPVDIHYDGMILMAILGFAINLIAAFLTHKGDSLHQKTVNLHMLEDTLGWCAVLVGALLMRVSGWNFIDPLLSIAVAVFIFINGIRHMSAVVDVFSGKVPHGTDLQEIRTQLASIDDVLDVHHLHIWSIDGYTRLATLHLTVMCDAGAEIKARARDVLAAHGINHATLELENKGEICSERNCCLGTREHREVHNHCHH